MQTHHVEIRSADDTSADFARLAEADHGESDGGKVSKGGERFDTRAQILDFRHRERHVIRAHTWRALADIDEAALVAVDERTKEYAAHQGEDGGVGADAKREREHNGDSEPFRATERAQRNFQIVEEQFRFVSHQEFIDWHPVPPRGKTAPLRKSICDILLVITCEMQATISSVAASGEGVRKAAVGTSTECFVEILEMNRDASRSVRPNAIEKESHHGNIDDQHQNFERSWMAIDFVNREWDE